MVRKLFSICEIIRATLTVRWHLSAILAVATMIGPGMAAATNKCDPTASGNCYIVDSAGSGDATGVQSGISLASTGDTVRVLSGTTGEYDEAVVLDRDITLECEGPDLVNIRNSSGNTITVNPGRTVSIRGCTITGLGGKGIQIQQGANADIANNVLWGNATGVGTDGGDLGTVVIRNNMVTANSGKGVDLAHGGGIFCHGNDISRVVVNNIVSSNGSCGVDMCGASGLVDVEYNNSVGNNPNYCNGSGGTGSISTAPNFMNEGTGDFRLSSSSTSRNVGKPGYNDPDGTRNDLGAYGGPDSAGFFPSPEGGPTIRTMSIFPSSVPKNGTITLQATGQVAVP